MIKYRKSTLALTLAALCAWTSAVAQGPQLPPPLVVKDDGTIVVPSFELPFSSYASPEAVQEFVQRMRNPLPRAVDLAKIREDVDARAKTDIEKLGKLYPYSSTKSRMGGVPVETFVPTAGISAQNQQRVLINVHGGAFVAGGGGSGGAIESILIAGALRMKVVAVDYRLGPEHKFPAASEDLAAVYRELLKSYRPENIGIFGCSAGGLLSAQAIPWFLKEKLPLPGAIGIFCGSTHRFGAGDAFQIWPRLGSVIPYVPPSKPATDRFEGPDLAYFGTASPQDPLAVPAASKEVLKAFPPTLILTGTRAPDMSGAVTSHLELVEAGVKSQLLLFDGLDHGFISHPELPESKRAYALIARFFGENLGTRANRK